MPFDWLTAITVFVLLLPLLWLFLEDRRNRMTPQQLEQHALEYREQLLKPDWDAVQDSLENAVIPTSLKALYANTELLLSDDFYVRTPNDAEWYIVYFSPANEELVSQIQELPRNSLVFATDENFGSYFIVAFDEDISTPVFFYGDNGIEAVAPSLETFLSWPRIKDAAT